MVSVLILGTAIWFVAFLVLLPFRGRLDGAGHGDWVWIGLAGWTLGLVGIVVARAQRAARHAAERVAGEIRSGPATGNDGTLPGHD